MKNSILTKFFIGYFSFAVFGFMIITYWSTNLIYNHLLKENVEELSAYSQIIADDISNAMNNSGDEILDNCSFFQNFKPLKNYNVTILDSNKKIVYATDKSGNLNNTTPTVVNDFNPSVYSHDKHQINNFYNIYKTKII